MDNATDINLEALRTMINWLERDKQLLNATRTNLAAGLDFNTKKNLFKLSELIDKIRVMEVISLIYRAVENKYPPIENAVARKLQQLRSRLLELEDQYNKITLDDNNKSRGLNINDILSERKKIEQEIAWLEEVAKNPAVIANYILEKEHIQGNATDLASFIINSDDYLVQNHQSFAKKTDTRVKIVEPNIMLALEVAEGNTSSYQGLASLKMVNAELKKLTSFNIKIQGASLFYYMTSFCSAYRDLLLIKDDIHAKEREYSNHPLKGLRGLLSSDLWALREMEKVILDDIKHTMANIIRTLNMFEKAGIDGIFRRELLGIIKGDPNLHSQLYYEWCPLVFKDYDSLKPVDEIPYNESTFKTKVENNYKLSQDVYYKLKEKYEGQITPGLIEADTGFVPSLKGNGGSKFSKNKDLQATKISLYALLVLNGFSKDIDYGQLLLNNREKMHYWDKVNEYIKTFIEEQIYTDSNRQQQGKALS